MLSPTEENYLKAIYLLSHSFASESPDSPKGVSTNEIARRMQTSAASVTDMLRKLSSKELIDYEKYQGVHLTLEGEKIALQVIRRHRLWETFLVDKLNFSWDEIHEIAEQLEHVQSERLIQRLDAFLDYPKFDPHGDPIPNKSGVFTKLNIRKLSDFEKGAVVKVINVLENSSELLQYLDKLGIYIGCEIEIVDKIVYDLSVEVSINKKPVLLSKQVVEKIVVSDN
jgi:DtxR family Mn-dependent transcriptional regulator